jgi:hypothetical protein
MSKGATKSTVGRLSSTSRVKAAIYIETFLGILWKGGSLYGFYFRKFVLPVFYSKRVMRLFIQNRV